MIMTKWTEEQLEAINKEGSNIIVSAGAGSGKTAVLTQRVIRKLKDGIDINRLLVLTFTNAAAAEMKERIRKAIIKEGLISQLDYLDSAYITTFDSYAHSIVKKYHYLLNISSSLNIIDDTVLSIVENKFIDEIFDSLYGNTDFDNLISNFCDKDDALLKKSILGINDKINLKSNKKEYLESYLNNHYNDEYINSIVDEYETLALTKKDEIHQYLYDIEILADGEFYSALSDYLNHLLESSTYDELKGSFPNTKYPMLKTEDINLKNKYLELKKYISDLKDMVYYSSDELKHNLLSTKNNVNVIIYIINCLDEKISSYEKKYEVYTFTDIAKMAIKIVNDNKEVQNELKNYYNEIMVDEYQDTSDLQEDFINLIAHNNVYMVGDIKQSIYRFRHANPEIFRQKYNSYYRNIGGYKIDLLKNFRSREEVLNNINSIFDNIMDEKIGNAEYKESHRMVFGNHMYDEKSDAANYNLDILNYKVNDDYKNYTKDEIEDLIIAKDIKNKVDNRVKIIDKDTSKLRDINYGDISIIMDRGTAFETYSKIFEYLKIPVVIWKDEVLTGEDDINIIKNIIGLIIKIKNNKFDQEFKYYFTSIARSYLFSYKDSDIFNYFYTNNFKDNDIYKIGYEISLNFDDMTNSVLLSTIIDKFDIYEKSILVGNTEKSIVRFDNLLNLFDSLSDLGYTPYNLLDYFDDSSNSEIRYSLNTKIPGNVNIMNIHKSKGLEFSVCYFSGFSKKFNTSDIKDSFIFDDKYGIIIPFYNDGIGDTVLKTLFKNKYNLDDISERIRLFYVAVTRAKEKMIMVTSLDDDDIQIRDKVDDSIRIKYNSFLSIMNSIKSKLGDYIKDVDLSMIILSKDYDLIKEYNYKDKVSKSPLSIDHISVSIDATEISESHFSKVTNSILTKEECDNMKFGTYMHYLLETTDFSHPDLNNKYMNKVLDFINKIDLNGAKVYKEYEFMYSDDNVIKHGIIDLMLEYSDHIDIIDYKLKNTVDDNYRKQVTGYKKYIENKTGKKVNTYLYSIFNEEFNAIV